MSHDIPQVNNVEMGRDKLAIVLEYFGYRVGEHFTHNIRLVIHGGACMLLHPGLYNLAKQQAEMTPQMQIRKTTRDVDFLHRAFASEMMAFNGDVDAPQKLQKCIRETAIRFGLGADWMNSAADVALPVNVDSSGRQYDPVYVASIQKTNIEHYTAFTSANGMVTLISVAPFWAIGLKLVRYNKWDPSDICLLLK
ncbi:hypothetical protein P691DRAFT_668818 [Macrolepiota fuliginosa MF-IS2]|uniref:Uncharacterized protein n=1 Tax=Macrolepiota fuliginosa MF-IS2 TaxID=1400762 RepID=A0A9P6C4U1_9AGAR|nr:hypothetical protein P691DRAFT_668818 [Macrolepiota fuliginosa MF-IS2]